MGLYLNVLNTNMIKIIMLPMLDIKYSFEYFIHFLKTKQNKWIKNKTMTLFY